MKPSPTDWQAIAEARLGSVLGPAKGSAALTDGLRALRLERLASARDLHRFAQYLIASGGFTSAVGGLLSVHAVMYGDDLELKGQAAAGSDPPA